ncbi:DUF3667 domain-containing protein [Stakelama sediminis]|uniref:DUF3667 domain-containing protein n=1 Tax=Stakelama sediminis TaxID=463200 RepID=A0A840YWR0_9SPHN|nr:DUF3667 domain-containing protein [Stakelama sediminis]MBB5717989.1 hypothetical protein [Stakelama sediminis]
MTGGIEGAGDFVTGALIGRALEPAHGEDGDDPHYSGICLNCGTALIGAHCHRCGQSGHIHRSVGAIGHDLLHGVFHFEGKLWRTLPMLAWRPGELTRRYIAGERARFVSPMALFLFSIFTMFAVFSIMGIAPPATVNTSPKVAQELNKQASELTVQRKEAVAERAKLAAGDPRAKELDTRIATLNENEKGVRKVLDLQPSADGLTKVHTGWHRLDHGIAKWGKNPGLMLYKLQSNSYKFSWLLIPLSLPFLWLLFFWKPGIHLYDHAIFATYSIAFMSLLFIAITIAGGLGVTSGWLSLAGTAIPVWHIHRQLKGAYRLGTFSAVWRTVVLIGFIGVVLILFIAALVMLGLVG